MWWPFDPAPSRPGAARTRVFWTVAALLAWPGAAPAQVARVIGPGDSVVLRSAAVTLRVETVTRPTHGVFHVYRAEQVQGDWVWVVAGSLNGWVRRGDLLPYDDAINYYTDAVCRHPDAAWAYVGRGLIWHQRRETELALADFDEAVRIDPALVPARIDRAEVRAALGDRAGSLADLDEALRLDPKSSLALAARGILRASRGDHQAAEADLDQAQRLDPDLPFILTARGDVARETWLGRSLALPETGFGEGLQKART